MSQNSAERRRLEEEDLCFCDAGTTQSAIDVDDFVQEYDSVWRGRRRRRRNLRNGGGIIGVASAGKKHETEAPTQVPSRVPSGAPSHSPTSPTAGP